MNDNVSEAHAIVHSGGLLLDVRTKEEHHQGNLARSKNIPVEELQARLGELPNLRQPVVVYCRSGKRSASAAQILIAAGFARVVDLGAMSNW